ncbi:arsenate reductase family protein [Mesonia sp.]|uniref:arsenate reductase family protein n=1 Tax=Mesonia sp. TaxID=1960830 RepID=UPI003F99CF71
MNMSVLAKSERQLLIIFHPDSELGKQCRAQAEAMDAKVLAINLKETKITGTEWAEIAKMLGKSVFDLIQQDHPAFKELYGDDKVSLEDHDAMKVLENNPETLVFPIAIRGEKALQANKTADLSKLFKLDAGEVDKN